jgi:hypothetical protein
MMAEREGEFMGLRGEKMSKSFSARDPKFRLVLFLPGAAW